MVPSRRSLLALSIALGPFTLAACHKSRGSTDSHVEASAGGNTLAVTSHLEGITAPCGCTSRPLGGLDRIAKLLETEKLPWLLVGNTFMTERAPSASMQGYVRTTAQIVARIVAKLHPVAVAAGPWDIGPMAPALLTLPKEVQAQLPNLAARGPARAPQLPRAGKLVTVAGLQLGLIEGPPLPPQVAQLSAGHSGANSIAFAAQDTGTTAATEAEGSEPLDVAALDADAKRLRQQGAVGVILLWPHGSDQARAQLTALQDIDIVLAGSEEAPKPAEALGSATLLDGGARGEYVGLLTLHPGHLTGDGNAQGHAGRLTFFDGGARERADAQQSHARFMAEAARLPEGPGKAARLQRAQALEAQMALIASDPPGHPHVTWQLRPMDQHLPQAPWATEALQGYNKALCDTALADTAARTCPAPATEAATYVGNATCLGCHQDAFAVWETTAHARAWATLEQADKTCDLSCVGCHVVGFEQPGGFCHLADAPNFHNVGCESCHGPGLGHVQHPEERQHWAPTFVRDTPEATCRGCHNSQHSDQFNFATYRPKILGPGHGLPKAP